MKVAGLDFNQIQELIKMCQFHGFTKLENKF